MNTPSDLHDPQIQTVTLPDAQAGHAVVGAQSSNALTSGTPTSDTLTSDTNTSGARPSEGQEGAREIEPRVQALFGQIEGLAAEADRSSKQMNVSGFMARIRQISAEIAQLGDDALPALIEIGNRYRSQNPRINQTARITLVGIFNNILHSRAPSQQVHHHTAGDALLAAEAELLCALLDTASGIHSAMQVTAEATM